MARHYVLRATITSKGTEEREFTPYDNEDTALRKYYEAFKTIGGGPKQIIVVLLDEWLNTIKKEVWIDEEDHEETTE